MAGLDQLQGVAETWTKPDVTPDESMLIAGIYAEECEGIAQEMKRALGSD